MPPFSRSNGAGTFPRPPLSRGACRRWKAEGSVTARLRYRPVPASVCMQDVQRGEGANRVRTDAVGSVGAAQVQRHTRGLHQENRRRCSALQTSYALPRARAVLTYPTVSPLARFERWHRGSSVRIARGTARRGSLYAQGCGLLATLRLRCRRFFASQAAQALLWPWGGRLTRAMAAVAGSHWMSPARRTPAAAAGHLDGQPTSGEESCERG